MLKIVIWRVIDVKYISKNLLKIRCIAFLNEFIILSLHLLYDLYYAFYVGLEVVVFAIGIILILYHISVNQLVENIRKNVLR